MSHEDHGDKTSKNDQDQNSQRTVMVLSSEVSLSHRYDETSETFRSVLVEFDESRPEGISVAFAREWYQMIDRYRSWSIMIKAFQNAGPG